MMDWRQLISNRAAQARVNLPTPTIEELAAHLDDISAGALNNGATADEARAMAMKALEESDLSDLRRHAVRGANRADVRSAHVETRAAGGRSLSVASAIRNAIRQFRYHPRFALLTVLVLGLGMGAATTVFTVVD